MTTPLQQYQEEIWIDECTGVRCPHEEVEQHDVFTRQRLDSITTQAYILGLQRALGLLPKEEYVTDCEHTPMDSCDTDCMHKSSAISFNSCRTEAETAITKEITSVTNTHGTHDT